MTPNPFKLTVKITHHTNHLRCAGNITLPCQPSTLKTQPRVPRVLPIASDLSHFLNFPFYLSCLPENVITAPVPHPNSPAVTCVIFPLNSSQFLNPPMALPVCPQFPRAGSLLDCHGFYLTLQTSLFPWEYFSWNPRVPIDNVTWTPLPPETVVNLTLSMPSMGSRACSHTPPLCPFIYPTFSLA